jgi:hypothetical protein
VSKNYFKEYSLNYRIYKEIRYEGFPFEKKMAISKMESIKKIIISKEGLKDSL